MGKASSAKKIKKVQQAGVSRSAGQRRNYGYPALIAAILIVGIVLVGFARSSRQETIAGQPVVGARWASAFAIQICDEVLPSLEGQELGAGFYPYEDGLILISPTGENNSGNNARFQLFADTAGLELSDDSFTVPASETNPEAKTVTNGDDCNGEPGRVGLYRWPPQAIPTQEPTVTTTDIGGVQFRENLEIFVLAFVPEGTEVKIPPSASQLNQDTAGEASEVTDDGASDDASDTESSDTVDDAESEVEDSETTDADTSGEETTEGTDGDTTDSND